MSDLQIECQTLRDQNRCFMDTVQRLQNKCDYLENQSRRNNLLFFGLPAVTSWDVSEEQVKKVIKEGMGIEEEIHVERAHRAGRATVVKFCFFKQRDRVLSQARRLKGSEAFRDIYVREDFSEIVQKKRKGLLDTQRDLRSRGQRAQLRFDKLVTNNGTFTYDLASQRVMRSESRAGRAAEASVTSAGQDNSRFADQNRNGIQSPSHRPAENDLLPVEDFPPLPAAREQDQLDRVHSQPQPRNSGSSQSGQAGPKQRQRTGGSGDGQSSQQRASSTRTDTTTRDERHNDVNTSSGSSNNKTTHHSSKYNLRTRGNTSAGTGPGPHGPNSSKRGTSTTTHTSAACSPLVSSPQTPRGFGRGRGRVSPSQPHIDSVFRVSQSDVVFAADTDHLTAETDEDDDLSYEDAENPNS